MPLLSLLLDMLVPPRDTERLVRTADLRTLIACAKTVRVSDRIVSLLPYRHPLVKACIAEAAIHANVRAQRLLADLLAGYLLQASAEQAAPDASPFVLVPIPLSRERRAARGYDQCERIAASAVARVPGIVLDTTLLVRTRDTVPQARLGRMRRIRNMRDAFALTRDPDPSRTYIVFDDVLSSGSTMAAALQAFSRRGVSAVTGIALAHSA